MAIGSIIAAIAGAAISAGVSAGTSSGGSSGGLSSAPENSSELAKIAIQGRRAIEGQSTPFENLLFQSAGRNLGLQGEYDLGPLGLDTGPALSDFVDPREGKRIAELQDQIFNLKQKAREKRTRGRRGERIQFRIQKREDELDELVKGQGITQEQFDSIEAFREDQRRGLVDLFDTPNAPHLDVLGEQEDNVIRQIMENVPPGGLREKLLADAGQQFGQQRGLLNLDDFEALRNFATGRLQSSEHLATTSAAGIPANEMLNLQADQNAFRNTAGAAAGVQGLINNSGIQDYLAQWLAPSPANTIGNLNLGTPGQKLSLGLYDF